MIVATKPVFVKTLKAMQAQGPAKIFKLQQGWGQVLFEVLESSTSTSSYFQVQVPVQVQNNWKKSSTSSTLSIKYKSSTCTLVTNNSSSRSPADGLCY